MFAYELPLLTTMMLVIRMCVAMAWPNPYATGTERIEEVEQDYYTHIISNLDLHDENSKLSPAITSSGLTIFFYTLAMDTKPWKIVVFGKIDADGSLEHQLTPILKMIDVGECLKEKTGG